MSADREGEPCHVPARPCEARNETLAHWIGNSDHHDWNRAACRLGRDHRRSGRGHEHAHIQPDELGRERGQPVVPVSGEAGLKDSGSAVHMTEVRESGTESIDDA